MHTIITLRFLVTHVILLRFFFLNFFLKVIACVIGSQRPADFTILGSPGIPRDHHRGSQGSPQRSPEKKTKQNQY